MTLAPDIAAKQRTYRAVLRSMRNNPEKPGVWLWTQVSDYLWAHPTGDGETYHMVLDLDGVFIAVGLFGEYETVQDAFSAATQSAGLHDFANEWVVPGERAPEQEELLARYMRTGQRCGYHNPDGYAVDYSLHAIGNGVHIRGVSHSPMATIVGSDDIAWERARAWVGAHGGTVVKEVRE